MHLRSFLLNDPVFWGEYTLLRITNPGAQVIKHGNMQVGTPVSGVNLGVSRMLWVKRQAQIACPLRLLGNRHGIMHECQRWYQSIMVDQVITVLPSLKFIYHFMRIWSQSSFFALLRTLKIAIKNKTHQDPMTPDPEKFNKRNFGDPFHRRHPRPKVDTVQLLKIEPMMRHNHNWSNFRAENFVSRSQLQFSPRFLFIGRSFSSGK